MDISLHTPPYETTIGFNSSLHQVHSLSEYKSISYLTIPFLDLAQRVPRIQSPRTGIQHLGSSNDNALGHLEHWTFLGDTIHGHYWSHSVEYLSRRLNTRHTLPRSKVTVRSMVVSQLGAHYFCIFVSI